VKAFFDRHQRNYTKAKAKGLAPHDSKAIQAWLLWGGSPMYRQATRAVERDKAKHESPKKTLSRYMRDKYGV
jgi:hypothetical protein